MALQFQGSSSTTVNVTNGDDVVVYDYGFIGVSSGTGVDLGSGSLRTQLVNFGDIAAGRAVNVSSDFSQVINYGRIHAIDTDAINIAGAGGTHDIVNYGTITSDSFVVDTYDSTGSLTVTLTNTGEITAINGSSLIYDDGSLDLVRVSNSGFMRGGELGMSGEGAGILLNTGTIEATEIDLGAGDGGTLVNHGVLNGYYGLGHVEMSAVEDTAVNSGTIFGDIDLNEGADRYEGVGSGAVTEDVDGGSGSDVLAGGDVADNLRGGADDDLVVGRGGNDALQGDAGADRVIGGQGDDTLYGGDNGDTLNGNAGVDELAGGGGADLLAGQAGSDMLDGGEGNDTMDGGSGNDILEGDAGTDVIRGRGGEDELSGGEGLDFLTGGQEADTFVFRNTSHAGTGANRDQVLDFEQGIDQINVVGMSPGVFEFRDTAAFAPSGNPELRLIETATGSTIVQFDVDGDAAPDAEIRVAEVTGLTAEDFAL